MKCCVCFQRRFLKECKEVGVSGNSLMLWLQSAFRLLFPRRCAVCDTTLQDGEEALCFRCNINLPRTYYHLEKDNEVDKMFWGKIPLVRATSYIFYQKGGDFRRILHLLKYSGHKDLGNTVGRMMAADIGRSGFFEGIDVIVPVPLHPAKLRQRGYNQSECLAKGISEVTGIPVDTASVKRRVHTSTQTRKSVYERWENVHDIFYVADKAKFAGRHVLLVDDVLTTGATLTACADALADVENVRFSVLTLAVARG